MSTTQTFGVTGMTCAHCVAAVQSEIGALDGVRDVSVDLDPRGVSRVTVASTSPVPADDIAAALDEAGDYRVAFE